MTVWRDRPGAAHPLRTQINFMWILPKQLISAFAQDTEALTSDSVELSQTCAQSLMRRSKPSPAKTYLREWKAGNLMRLRSGAISSPSLGSSFLDWWTSSLAATRVSHSVVQASEPEQTTHDTSGRLFQPELLQCDQVSVSLKTSKDISRWGCPTLSKTWADWVTEQRGAYSARLKSARLTSESECSSWPTVTANEDSYRIGGNSQQSKCLSAMARRGEMSGPVALENSSTHGSRPGLWATPRAEHDSGGHLGTKDTLHSQMKAWATATVSTGAHRQKDGSMTPKLDRQVNGKLNPRWVETLMGLPVGWTMPSCASPVTIVPMSCASSATESSQQQQH